MVYWFRKRWDSGALPCLKKALQKKTVRKEQIDCSRWSNIFQMITTIMHLWSCYFRFSWSRSNCLKRLLDGHRRVLMIQILSPHFESWAGKKLVKIYRGLPINQEYFSYVSNHCFKYCISSLRSLYFNSFSLFELISLWLSRLLFREISS